MRSTYLRFVIPVVAAAAILVPQSARAVTNVFYGEVVHVSTTNLKVRDPHTGQILAFVLVPHFNKLFSDNGRTTYQMTYLHNGRYVAVVYDQKGLGIRHADRIYIMNDANERLKKVTG